MIPDDTMTMTKKIKLTKNKKQKKTKNKKKIFYKIFSYER
jgi:hypothetical protein